MELLESFPTMAHIYDPAYDAAAAPSNCRRAIVPKTHCCLYYTVGEKERALYFLRLSDTRESPLAPWHLDDDEEE